MPTTYVVSTHLGPLAVSVENAIRLVRTSSKRKLTEAEDGLIRAAFDDANNDGRRAINTAIVSAENEVKLQQELRDLGRTMSGDPVRNGDAVASRGGLYGALQAAGFDPQSQPHAVLGFDTFRLGAAATFDGSYVDAVPSFTEAPPLGSDGRFLFPILPTVREDPDVTAVQSFRQKARTLPSPLSGMIRAIDAVTTKPEVGTQTELLDVPMKQIAAVESGVPNIMLASSRFAGWINSDLTFAYNNAVDYHVLAQIAASTPTAGAAGIDLLESIVSAVETVAAAGYSATVLAASPETLIELLLLKQPGTDDYVFSGNAAPLNLRKVAVTGLDVAYVLDPSALGSFHVSPVTVRAFEENSGKTNTQTVRIESNGVFVVQRDGAVAEVDLGGSA